MVVITLEKCPPALRGDLTKWLQEISEGVYVGNVDARVRDNLWQRVCSEAKNGRATMAFSARNEQRLDFRVHNTPWEPIDFDGLKLMLRPSPARVKALGKKRVGFSDAAKRSFSKHTKRGGDITDFAVVDIETTGLDAEKDEIIEIAAIRPSVGGGVERMQTFVRPERGIPDSITELTGITQEDVDGGLELSEAIDALLEFVGTRPLVMHNSEFDLGFIDAAMESMELDELDNQCFDTLELARKKLPGMSGYRLDDLAQALEIEHEVKHRAMSDCETTMELFMRLIAL